MHPFVDYHPGSGRVREPFRLFETSGEVQPRSVSGFRNNLLARLSDDDRSVLKPHLELVDMPRRFVIAEPHQAIRYVYFLEAGLGSMVATSPEGLKAEVGIFGRDGFSPTSVVMGDERSFHSNFMQIGGSGFRIEAGRLEEASEKSPTLRKLLLRYAGVYANQTCLTALSNAVHQVNERLARWILMCHDRVDSDDIPLTHEFLSIMLAVRRPTVTTGLHVLEGNHFIRSERGYVTVRNRHALEQFAGDAYGQPEAEYRRLIGPL